MISSCEETCFDLLLIEMLHLYGNNNKRKLANQAGAGAGAGVGAGGHQASNSGAQGGSGLASTTTAADPRLYRERSNTGTGTGTGTGLHMNTTSSSSSSNNNTNNPTSGSSVVLGVEDALDSMGFQVGCQLGERYSKNKARSEDTLDIVKFLCKEFWTEVFKKQIDNLKTNHKVSQVY